MAQTPSPSMVEIPVEVPKKLQWECSLATQPKDAKGFTVGETFEMRCAGTSLPLEEPLRIVNPEKIKYSLVYLKTLKKTENELSFLATTYMPTPVEHPFIHVVDAKDGGFISQKFQLKAQSVIDPKKPPEAPFGPIQPMSLAWPYWIFFVALICAAVAVAWGLVFLRRYLQQRHLEKNIRKFQSPLGSYHQFSKDLRLLKRGVIFSGTWSESQTQSYMVKLDEIFRMFVLREYTVPALSWSISRIAQQVHKKNRNHYSDFKNEFLKAFNELERAKSQIHDLKPQDCEQLTNLCWVAVDTMWKYRRAVKL